jgi:hypothetical protein
LISKDSVNSQDNEVSDRPNRTSRASMLGSVAFGTLLAAAAAAPVSVKAASALGGITDTDILNFALNLEYLEAEFYNFSVYGHGIQDLGVPVTGKGASGPTYGGSKTTFSNKLAYETATELASDERDHVLLLRSVLGKDAIAKPAINLEALGMSEKMSQFLVLARAFEDTGVSAYAGAAPLVQSKDVLGYAARILAVEAYHAGNIRLMTAFFNLETAKIDSQDILPPPTGSKFFTDTPGQALAVVRAPAQVLAIVRPFFPHGLNGKIR